MSEPFVEHPTGEFDSALDAMEDTVRRLRELPNWEQWITFSAQGEGREPGTYEFAEVRMLGPSLDMGDKPFDVSRILDVFEVPASSLVMDAGKYLVGSASPRQVAQILAVIFPSFRPPSVR